MVLRCILIDIGGDFINCSSCGYHTLVGQYGYTSIAAGSSAFLDKLEDFVYEAETSKTIDKFLSGPIQSECINGCCTWIWFPGYIWRHCGSASMQT